MRDGAGQPRRLARLAIAADAPLPRAQAERVTQVTVARCLPHCAAALWPQTLTPGPKRIVRIGPAQRNTAMNTLFDDIATTLVTAAFAIASASGMIALLAGAL